jgi:hypothetical protein
MNEPFDLARYACGEMRLQVTASLQNEIDKITRDRDELMRWRIAARQLARSHRHDVSTPERHRAEQIAWMVDLLNQISLLELELANRNPLDKLWGWLCSKWRALRPVAPAAPAPPLPSDRHGVTHADYCQPNSKEGCTCFRHTEKLNGR